MEQINPLTDRQLAEILWAARSRAREVLNPSPLSKTPAYTRKRYRRFAAEVRYLLNQKRNTEVQRLRKVEAERDAARAELEKIRTTETDVTWLADGVRRIIDGISVRTAKDPAHAQSIIAREAASLINAGILTAFVSSKVVDLSVEHIKKAEAERDRLAEQVNRVRTWHWKQCTGACGLDDGCECEERDLFCGECNERWPCGTIRALDGTEAGQ